MAAEQLTLNKKVKTSIVLANADELISSVIKNIAGNDISNSINGSKANSEVIHMLANQRILKTLSAQNKA